MKRLAIRGRRRILDPQKKARLCDMVARSASVEEAAETLDVSLRTVQRERRLDEDFDHELRLALQAPPDPRKLMEQAARTHWRAAAWLLERTDPEQYARRPVNTANPRQVECAIRFVLEAALEATAPERREAVYRHVQAACERAFACCFPNYSPWSDPRRSQLPPTPHADRQLLAEYAAPARQSMGHLAGSVFQCHHARANDLNLALFSPRFRRVVAHHAVAAGGADAASDPPEARNGNGSVDAQAKPPQ